MPCEDGHSESATNYCGSCESPCRKRYHKDISVITALPSKSKVPRKLKKQNLITVNILTAHPVLTSQLHFLHKTNTQNLQHESEICCINP